MAAAATNISFYLELLQQEAIDRQLVLVAVGMISARKNSRIAAVVRRVAPQAP